MDLQDRVRRLEGRLERANLAREEAETLLEHKSLELFEANSRLTLLNEWLESTVEQRTTELREALAHAEAATRMKSEFLATMSHEIRTPMNGVLGTLDLLLEMELSCEQRHLAEVADGASRQLLGLLDDLLDLSKIESGEARLQLQPVSIPHIVGSVVELFRAKGAAKGVKLQAIVDLDDEGWVMADPAYLRRALFNLVGNATKFTDVGSVTVRASRTNDDQVRIDVADTGPGIPAAEQQKLFQAFSQVSTANTRAEGTGLGLAITQRLVEELGGKITIESDSDAGAVFSMVMPLPHTDAPAPSKAAQTIEQEAVEVDLSGLDILVVDDVPTNQMVAQTLLQRLGAQVTLADNGQEAVDFVMAQRFDLVLMDVSMPVMNGYQATREIRARGLDKRVLPILGLTAHAFDEDIESCLAAGMNDFVAKPIRRSRLLPLLNKYLKPSTLNPETGGVSDANSVERKHRKKTKAMIPPPAVIEADVLEQLAADVGDEMVPVLLDQFVSEIERRVSSIHARAEEGDIRGSGDEAHALKSTAGTFGALSFRDCLAAIEEAGARNDADGVTGRLGNLKHLADKVVSEVAHLSA